jgi:hypothetical protein
MEVTKLHSVQVMENMIGQKTEMKLFSACGRGSLWKVGAGT